MSRPIIEVVAKGESGVGAAVANVFCNATGIRTRDYPITLDKHLEKAAGPY